jgi:hypothetical protein
LVPLAHSRSVMNAGYDLCVRCMHVLAFLSWRPKPWPLGFAPQLDPALPCYVIRKSCDDCRCQPLCRCIACWLAGWMVPGCLLRRHVCFFCFLKHDCRCCVLVCVSEISDGEVSTFVLLACIVCCWGGPALRGSYPLLQLSIIDMDSVPGQGMCSHPVTGC